MAPPSRNGETGGRCEARGATRVNPGREPSDEQSMVRQLRSHCGPGSADPTRRRTRYRAWVVCVAALVVACVTGCASPHRVRSGSGARDGARQQASPPAWGGVASGIASYYAARFDGRKTASGETFSNRRMTAAHRTLPFGTTLRVTNLTNGRSVTVRVNDRGPFVRGRVVDLSHAAALKLDMIRAGTAPVKLQVVSRGRAMASTD
jgi:rare lipoprotein A